MPRARHPIPKNLYIAFMAHCDGVYSDDSLPDGAWFAMLEEQAKAFMGEYKLTGCENSAVHQLLWLHDQKIKKERKALLSKAST